MYFNHLEFFTEDAATWHDKFVEEWGATPLSRSQLQGEVAEGDGSRVLCLGQVPIVIAAPAAVGDAVDHYLRHHPPGIGDVAFRVRSLKHTISNLEQTGSHLLEPIHTAPTDRLHWCRVPGWGKLRHTLVQTDHPGLWIPPWGQICPPALGQAQSSIRSIDHAVLNVPVGQLKEATNWYIDQLGFRPRQQFTIDTPNSGLRSLVLAHPLGNAQLPINEPATPNSQIQEFLTWNQGAGIQHVALQTQDILQTVQSLKVRGIQFLNVPDSYYQALTARSGFQIDESIMQTIRRLEILVDWEPQRPEAHLLQTFTQPLLEIPTLFFEIIQRRTLVEPGYAVEAQGFGERNFQALFEAIEREQSRRGSLEPFVT